MASYNELNALIDAYINRNGIQAITGQVLNGVLKAMVDQLGRGYTIMGAALPTTDPGTPDSPESWFAATPGTYPNFGGLEVADAELALLSYTPSAETWTKTTLTEGITEITAGVDNNVGTPYVEATYQNGALSFQFYNLKGNTGDAAGFGAVSASVDATIGTPSVSVQTSGPDTAKNIAFAFHNLKGETGVTSVIATVDNTTGTPACAVSLVGQELHLDFTGLKGAQGNTGSSVDYPFTIVNNLTTNDATQALSAAMGVQLEAEVSQLEAEIYDYDPSQEVDTPISEYTDFNGLARISSGKYESSTAATIWIRGINVQAGKKYKIKTLSSGEPKSISVNTAWAVVMFSEQNPANGGDVTTLLSSSSTTIILDDTFTPEANGFLGVGINGASVILNRLNFYEVSVAKELKTDILERRIDDLDTEVEGIQGDVETLSGTVEGIAGDVDGLEGRVENIEDDFYDEVTEVVTRTVTDRSIFNGIARLSTLKYEAGSATANTLYIPVVAGRQYRVKTSQAVSIQTVWITIAFSTVVPAANVSAVNVKTLATTPTDIDETYTPNADGYLGVCLSGDISLLAPRVSFTETYTETVKVPVTDELNERIDGVEFPVSRDAAQVLVTPPQAFNIGLTKLQAKTTNPTPLSITSSGSNYNTCIGEYMNRQEDRRTSRLIPSAKYNLYPNIGDPTKLYGTYYRMLIGVDSEGYAYVAQRKCANNSQGADVNIYKTKDFETFTLFKANSAGAQLVEMDNGEICLATYETETTGGTTYIRCFIYITENNKTTFVKKFACSQISQYIPAAPWSWGIQSRGSVVCIGEYGQHGQCGCVWYSRDYGQTFGKIFDLRDNAPDVPHAHIHGVCVDPYFDRVIIINGDGSPSTPPELAYHNPKLWWWDYNGETIDDNLADTIVWKSSDVGLDTSLGSNLQFVNGYALKDCIVLFSDGANNGIFRVNRGKKEDTLKVDFALHLGIETGYTEWCGGNMFRRDENSPLLICAIREYSCDLDPGDPNNPSNKPNTYKDILSRVYSTYDGFHFEEVWVDDTYGTYDVFYTDDSSEQRTLAKCGRDMSVYQMPNGDVLIKYLGRDFQYVAYNNNGVTGNKTAYVRFNNEVAKFRFK